MTLKDERAALQRYSADLHIHTALSPCAEIEMLPSLIITAAQMAELDIIAITDHNSCANAGAVVEAAKGSAVKVLPGMEVQSVEGVHLLCLFDDIDSAMALQNDVYAALSSHSGPDADRAFGQQAILDANDELVGYCEKYLSLPASLDIDGVCGRVAVLNGLVIPSHIDRHGTGLCDVLGMMPENPIFSAAEISPNTDAQEVTMMYPSAGRCSILHNSDAHWLAAIGERRTILYLAHRTLEEIKLACSGQNGRRVADA